MVHKKSLFAASLLVSIGFGSVVYAGTFTYGDRANGAKSTERWHQLNYLGEAWVTRPGHKTGIYYYRNNQYVGGTEAYKDSWRKDNTRVHTSTVVWDSFNWDAPKTIVKVKV